jgi:murein DD-endopeptidase MepM/ murein hydrolase activator NlpD
MMRYIYVVYFEIYIFLFIGATGLSTWPHLVFNIYIVIKKMEEVRF